MVRQDDVMALNECDRGATKLAEMYRLVVERHSVCRRPPRGRDASISRFSRRLAPAFPPPPSPVHINQPPVSMIRPREARTVVYRFVGPAVSCRWNGKNHFGFVACTESCRHWYTKRSQQVAVSLGRIRRAQESIDCTASKWITISARWRSSSCRDSRCTLIFVAADCKFCSDARFPKFVAPCILMSFSPCHPLSPPLVPACPQQPPWRPSAAKRCKSVMFESSGNARQPVIEV